MIYQIEKITSDAAEKLYRKITADLPEYFGLPECNEQYALGVRSLINFAAKIQGNSVGLLSLDFPYPTTCNIYWMGILREHQRKGLGQTLIHQAAIYAKECGTKTMTVETLDPNEADENYLKTYKFYESVGFKPLLNLKPAGYEWNMVYMLRNLDDLDHTHALTGTDTHISIQPFIKSDISAIVSSFNRHNWPKPQSTFDAYFLEQQAGERLIWVARDKDLIAGYITLKWRSHYPPFQEQNIPEIMDLNVLPPFRGQGIASQLLKIAEEQAAIKSSIIGLGVGLYPDYGQAQKLYIKLGYIPDGLGITYNYTRIAPGENVRLDDDLVLWFTKKLSKFTN